MQAVYWMIPRVDSNAARRFTTVESAVEFMSNQELNDWIIVKVDDYGETIVNCRLKQQLTTRLETA